MPHVSVNLIISISSGDGMVKIGLDNGLLSDGTKPLSEPMLTNNRRGLLAFT